LLRGKWKEVKRCFSFSFHWPLNIGTFQGPLSIGTFHWPLNIGTFQGPPSNGTFQGPPNNGTFQGPSNIRTIHWPPSWDFPSLLSFSFSLKGKFRSFGAFLSGHNFRFESWEYLFPQPSGTGEEWLVLVNGGKRESRLDVCSTFERMELNTDNVRSLKS
jgi:hypothetical protein